MILPNPQDAVHKAWLYRLLSSIYDKPQLAKALYFKGGTCAAMLDWLDRFSVDLDFDYVAPKKEMSRVSQELEKVFKDLGIKIKDKSKKVPQYFLCYPAPQGERNTIKIDTTLPPPRSNQYQVFHLADIERIVRCQTKETMFANKLVALIERHEQHESIAGRDLYDIHYFFLQGFRYNEDVIIERRKKTLNLFFKELIKFIENNINQTIINQDLNVLLPAEKFQQIRKILKKETLIFLKDELARIDIDQKL